MAKYQVDAQGRKTIEIADKQRIEVPLRYRQGPSLDERVQSLLRAGMLRMQQDEEAEDEREARDFDVDVDPEDIKSMHELDESVDAYFEAKENLEREFQRVQKERRDGIERGDIEPGGPEDPSRSVGGAAQRAKKTRQQREKRTNKGDRGADGGEDAADDGEAR